MAEARHHRCTAGGAVSSFPPSAFCPSLDHRRRSTKTGTPRWLISTCQKCACQLGQPVLSGTGWQPRLAAAARTHPALAVPACRCSRRASRTQRAACWPPIRAGWCVGGAALGACLPIWGWGSCNAPPPPPLHSCTPCQLLSVFGLCAQAPEVLQGDHCTFASVRGLCGVAVRRACRRGHACVCASPHCHPCPEPSLHPCFSPHPCAPTGRVLVWVSPACACACGRLHASVATPAARPWLTCLPPLFSPSRSVVLWELLTWELPWSSTLNTFQVGAAEGIAAGVMPSASKPSGA